MMHADGVPDDDVRVTDGPVGCRPRRQPLAGLAQGRMIAGGMTFLVPLRRDPEVIEGR